MVTAHRYPDSNATSRTITVIGTGDDEQNVASGADDLGDLEGLLAAQEARREEEKTTCAEDVAQVVATRHALAEAANQRWASVWEQRQAYAAKLLAAAEEEAAKQAALSASSKGEGKAKAKKGGAKKKKK